MDLFENKESMTLSGKSKVRRPVEPIKPFSFSLTDDEIERFQQESAKILRSGTLILGEYTERFEGAFAEYIGTKHAVAVNSGSSALEFLLRTRPVKGHLVLVPTNTNFATVAAILRVGGKVRYLDMDEETFAPSLAHVEMALKRRPSTEGLLWVHIGGVISPEFPDIVSFCRQKGLFVFEDAAHAHGSQIMGVRAGALADGGAFSFFPTKVMTTGEGGMVTTESDADAKMIRSLRNQGKRGMKFGGLHHDFGNSSRITEIGALLGLIQLERLPRMLAKRQIAYDIIAKRLDKAGLAYVSTRHMEMASQYKMIVLVPEGKKTDAVKKKLSDEGVICGGGVYEIPCHRQPVFEGVDMGDELPVADRWCPNHLCPPITSTMTTEEADRVGEALVRHLA